MSEHDDDEHLTSWEELEAELPSDERKAAAYGRMIEAHQLLYKLWERRSNGMNRIGEVIGEPPGLTNHLWVTETGERVAVLGGYLEVVAVFPDESVTLMLEPGPSQPSTSPS